MTDSSFTASRWVRPPALWVLPASSDPVISQLQAELSIGRLAAQILANRGYTTLEAAREFLSPDGSPLHDPLLLRDMDRAVERLMKAVRERERILIYGDYDVDGTASIVILKKAIEILGGIADFYIPHRLTEGYGMKAEVIERAAETGVRLVVSVDTGIRALQVVRHANTVGIDVIVTDHHLPESELPPALAVLNPNRPDCQYPFKDLCGAGVTLKLVQALLERSDLPASRRAALLDSFLKPVAIATVADIVPLNGENRTVVRRGLSGLRDVRNHGLRSLIRVAGLDEGEAPSAHQVAFRLAPRINAAGRMSTARDVIELFLTNDSARAQALAEQLDIQNRERQQVEATIVDTILKQCEGTASELDAAALVFAGENWHLGVLGIVASRLVERFCRPVFVLSNGQHGPDNEPCFTGSGRSIPDFHLLGALETMSELFTKFGGHRQAAGLTLRAAHVPEFRKRFAELGSQRLTADHMRPRYRVDATVDFPELTEACVADVLSLGPFGFGNASPIIAALGVAVAGPPRILPGGKHLNVPLHHHGRTLFAKAWNFGDRAHLFEPKNRLDVLLQIEDDPYSRKRGFGSWCVSLKDARPSG
ncbi:MAG: single-stranded-DNA-specific exonuclease RecJ [Bryobacteraceae bacterium]